MSYKDFKRDANNPKDAQLTVPWGTYPAEVAKGLVPSVSRISKFGHAVIGTTLKPISTSLTYFTPTSPVALEVVSDNAADNPAGTGANTVVVIGLDSTWTEISQTVTMNGITPVALPIPMTRVYRAYVATSQSYASQSVPTHLGVISVRETATPLNIWAQIDNTPTPIGQSEIGVYTIPKGKIGYLWSKSVYADVSKSINMFFFYRDNADTVTAPFSPMRLIQREVGISGASISTPSFPKGPYVGPCDIGFMGIVSNGTDDVSVEFEIELEDA